MNKFETGQFSISNEENKNKSAKELEELKEKLEIANLEKLANLGGIYLKQTNEAFDKMIDLGLINENQIEEFLKKVKERREIERE